MIYPENFEHKLGFDKIRHYLKEYCLSSLGKAETGNIQFSTNRAAIEKELNLVEEMREILLFGQGFPAQNYFDLRVGIQQLKIKGNWMDVEQLGELRAVLSTIQGICDFLLKDEEPDFPGLAAMAATVDIDPSVTDRLNHILDKKGQIRDQASPLLAEIRKKLEALRGNVETEIHRMMKHARSSGWVPDDTDITVRDGRLVIPVHASAKKKMDGLIHDRSSTGQTLYIEPREIFESNNEIRELELDEREEIHRILVETADKIRPGIPGLLKAFSFLGRIDFLRAKGKLAIKLESHKPLLGDEPRLEWFDARHPLLFLSHQAQGKKVVPLKIKLNKKNRILIISGPNAGGKSVALKTIGLLQYMLQCGITIPMRPTSEAGIFQDILIDIGDQQSLENDLSTYSSHLLNMKHFLQYCGRRSLFLIDEFGSGTEPRFGGALAEAILEGLYQKGSFGVVTTHYANLKALPDRFEGMMNGAMQFDVENIEPLFILESGKPGSSFAFEIASRIGLEKEILDTAVEKSGEELIKLDRQLQQVANDQRAVDAKKTELRVADDFLAEMIEKYQKLAGELENKKKSILNQARNEAREILENSNKLIEKTIREIRENQADKERTRQARDELQREKEQFSERHKQQEQEQDYSPKENEVNRKRGKQQQKDTEKKQRKREENKKKRAAQTNVRPEELRVGDRVKMQGQDTVGEILAIKGSVADIAMGSMKLKLPIDRLVYAGTEKPSKSGKSGGNISRVISDINDKMANFSPQLDLRGFRAEEARNMLEAYIDEAILLSVKDLRILHGKGDGVLRQIVRDFLAGQQEVQRFRDEHVELGGHGVTIVTLK